MFPIPSGQRRVQADEPGAVLASSPHRPHPEPRAGDAGDQVGGGADEEERRGGQRALRPRNTRATDRTEIQDWANRNFPSTAAGSQENASSTRSKCRHFKATTHLNYPQNISQPLIDVSKVHKNRRSRISGL